MSDHMCNLANCDKTTLGHELALDFPEETARVVEQMGRLVSGNREDRVMPENLRVDKPPLGLIPRFIHEEKRLTEIDAAIARYRDADPPWPVPIEWLHERADLLRTVEHEHHKRCCTYCGTHSIPHQGCILR